MLKQVLTTALVCSAFAGAVQAADFSLADKLFSEREGDVAKTQAARQAYQNIIKSGVKGTELERAVVGVLRTMSYEGEALTGRTADSDIERRRQLFKECADETTELITEKALGYQSPAYYYFKASCMAYYAEVSGTLENLTNAPRLLNALSKGLESQGGDTYEGGGLKRVKAAVKSNAKAKPIPGGLYNPEEALSLIDESIASQAYPGNYDGSLFCENYRRKINVLAELGRPAEAVEVASTTLEDFGFYLELGEIPESLVPETKHCLSVVESLKASIQ